VNEIQIRPLMAEDADAIPKLIESGIRAEIFPLTIFSSDKYNRYIKDRLVHGTDVAFYGAYRKGKLLGYAEWRYQEENLFLNNIYLAHENRGSGLGSQLFHQGVHSLSTPDTNYLSLDVFEDNVGARLWYERMGFVHLHSSFWHVTKHRRSEKEKAAYKVIDLELANKQHNSYGFSMLRIETNHNAYHIGRITDRYFRIQQENIHDRDLMIALNEIDAKRDLLLVSNHPFVEGFESICTSNRMTKSISTLRGGIYDVQNIGLK
jgi:ribosomal protein S18 acetylase RimI-like enzyme